MGLKIKPFDVRERLIEYVKKENINMPWLNKNPGLNPFPIGVNNSYKLFRGGEISKIRLDLLELYFIKIDYYED